MTYANGIANGIALETAGKYHVLYLLGKLLTFIFSKLCLDYVGNCSYGKQWQTMAHF